MGRRETKAATAVHRRRRGTRLNGEGTVARFRSVYPPNDPAGAPPPLNGRTAKAHLVATLTRRR